MSPLALRKQLLVAESELNRAALRADLAELVAGVDARIDRSVSWFAVAASALSLIGGLMAHRSSSPAAPSSRRSWIQTLTTGAGLVASVWQTFRSR